jgi:glucose/arabinose dehydrogenase
MSFRTLVKHLPDFAGTWRQYPILLRRTQSRVPALCATNGGRLRGLSLALGLLLALGWAGRDIRATPSDASAGDPAGGNRTEAAAAWPAIALAPFLDGVANVVQVTHAGDGTGRIFVVQQAGYVRLVIGGVLQATRFLDIHLKVVAGGEQGLLGIAFPPAYSTKQYFYVNYTRAGDGATVISRIPVSADPNVANPAGEQVLLVIPQPYANHNGGQIAFGPDDGYLYIGMGDGGSGGDPENRAQNPLSLLGKILRIDVESGANPYAIPPSNPFAGNPAWLPEIWALGVRNPWRFSFDRLTGDLYIGDVGQNAYEEIDFQPAGSPGGQNYGWRIMEGLHCYNPNPCNPAGLTLPVAEYPHGPGCSVTGGFVYRGTASPALAGIYFYGDYCSGVIWGLRQAAGQWETQLLLDTSLSITCFGEDEAGEVYVGNYAGQVYRISGQLPPCTAETGLVPGMPLLGVNLQGAGNDLQAYSCISWLSGGEDRLYAISLATPSRLDMQLAPQSPGTDPDLYVLSDCIDTGTCLGYGNNQVAFGALPAGTYYLAVDNGAAAGASVAFDLLLETGPTMNYGDVNSDGLVNSQDVVLIQVELAGAGGLPPLDLAAADVFHDGALSVTDLTVLAHYLVFNLDRLPAWDRK